MFDSGFGGLTVARAFIDLLPDQDLVYFGDTARYPYGTKSSDEVRSHSLQIAEHLADRYDMKMLVVACNTAAAAALSDLRAALDIPVVSVIEPGVRAAAQVTRSGRVGIIGTVGTVSSHAYEQAGLSLAADVDWVVSACPGFVEFVERGELDSPQVHVLAERLLAPVREANVDTLLLGCTHYPYLARTIGSVMGREVVLVSSADETAFEIRDLLLEDRHPARIGEHTFVSSGDADVFEALGRRLFGAELLGAEEHQWTEAAR